MKKTIWKWP